MTSTGVHLQTIEPAEAPGGLYVRICTVSGVLLGAHPITSLDEYIYGGADVRMTEGADDYRVAVGWLDDHPDDEVHVYIYDGDSGACVTTIVVKGVEAAFADSTDGIPHPRKDPADV